MARSNETGMDRLKKLKLWQWGLIVIWGGAMVGLLGVIQGPARVVTEAERAQALGRGAATLAIFLVGFGLIIAHFVRRKR